MGHRSGATEQQVRPGGGMVDRGLVAAQSPLEGGVVLAEVMKPRCDARAQRQTQPLARRRRSRGGSLQMFKKRLPVAAILGPSRMGEKGVLPCILHSRIQPCGLCIHP